MIDFGFNVFLGMLLARRFSGAFTAPCLTLGIIFFALIAGGIFLFIDFIRWKSFVLSRSEERGKHLFGAVFRLLLFLTAFYAILTPESSGIAKITAFLGMATVCCLWWAIEFSDRMRTLFLIPSVSDSVSDSVSAAVEGMGEYEEFEEDPEELLPFDVSQKLERSQTEQGEKVSGLLRGNFGSGQTKITLFAAFCPPLTRVPAIEAFIVEGEGVIETVRALPHGAEFVLRKNQRVPMEDSVILNFTALEFGDLKHE